MTAPLPATALRGWVEQQLQRAETPWRRGHQGQLLRYRQDGWDVVIKCPLGRGLRGWWSRYSLRREYRAYQRLAHVPGVPHCHGLLAGNYLVLDYVAARGLREAELRDRDAWARRLLTLIQTLHARGVAHGVLKRKANVLVTAQEQQVVVDVGTAWLRRAGFHPFNHWLFNYLARTDLNAYVKHKYAGRYADVSAHDRRYLRYSRLEALISAWRNWRARRRAARLSGG